MTKGAESVQDALTDAIDTESESASDEKEVTETQETTEETEVETAEKGKSHKGATDRIKELVTTKNDLKAELDTRNQELEQRSSAVVKLTDMLESSREDTDLLNQIRALATDDSMRPHLEAIDKKLKGVEEEVEEGTKSPKEGADDTRKLLKQVAEELDDKITQQEHNQILERADTLVDKYFDRLPEAYTEQDKERISRVLADYVDWQAIQDDPDDRELMAEKLANGLQEALDDYGEPQGVVAKKALEESNEDEGEEKEQTSSEPTVEDVLKQIEGMDFAEMKTVETKGGKTLVPKYTDEEFSRQAGRLLRAAQNDT